MLSSSFLHTSPSSHRLLPSQLAPSISSARAQNSCMSHFRCPSLISSSVQYDFHLDRPEVPIKEHLRRNLISRREFKERQELLSSRLEKLASKPQLLQRSLSGEATSSKVKFRTFLREPASSSKHHSTVTQVSAAIPAHLERPSQLAPADVAFLLLSFISCMTAGALISLVTAAIPMLSAMRKTAHSLERLAITAQKELPGAMAAITLSGLEIGDATMGITSLSQEISEGLRSSVRVVKVAEDGLRRIGVSAASTTLSMLQACLQS